MNTPTTSLASGTKMGSHHDYVVKGKLGLLAVLTPDVRHGDGFSKSPHGDFIAEACLDRECLVEELGD